MDLTEGKSPLIIAHRGYSARYPENTLVAIQAALDAGADVVEFDVALTRDRRVVVIHDDTLERTTDGKGRVDRCNLGELRGLDAGGWFSPRYYGERIPILDEVLELVGNHAGINIEIKSDAHEEPDRSADPIEKQVVDRVLAMNLGDSVIVSSFEWEILERTSRIDGAPRVALLSKEPADGNAFTACRRLDAFSWNQDHRKLSQQQVDLLHELGVRVFAYTVNSQRRLRRLLEMGIDGVFTDDPLCFV